MRSEVVSLNAPGELRPYPDVHAPANHVTQSGVSAESVGLGESKALPTHQSVYPRFKSRRAFNGYVRAAAEKYGFHIERWVSVRMASESCRGCSLDAEREATFGPGYQVD